MAPDMLTLRSVVRSSFCNIPTPVVPLAASLVGEQPVGVESLPRQKLIVVAVNGLLPC